MEAPGQQERSWQVDHEQSWVTDSSAQRTSKRIQHGSMNQIHAVGYFAEELRYGVLKESTYGVREQRYDDQSSSFN